jgi:hypothetical protein
MSLLPAEVFSTTDKQADQFKRVTNYPISHKWQVGS